MNVLIFVFCFCFFQMNCKNFRRNNRTTCMTVHVSQTPDGAGASVLKVGLRSTSQMRKYGRRVGRPGVGRDGTP